MTYWKNIILFGIKLALILKKNLIANLFTVKTLKTKITFFGDGASDFHDQDIPKVGYNYTWLAVIANDSALKKDKNYYPQVLLK